MQNVIATPSSSRHEAPRLTLRVEGATHLLYDRSDQRYRKLTTSEAFLLLASLEMGALAARALLGSRIGDDDAALAFATLETLGALTDGRFTGRVLELPVVDGAWSSPLVAHLGVTLACNFACSHCYSSSGKRAPGELSLTEIQAIVDALFDMGCMKLVLGGGEPFVRKDLAAVVAYANARGVDTFVHTNGSLLDEDVLRALSTSPPAGFAVSLDGPDEKTNDRVRGAGAFAKALRGLSTLRAHYAPGFHLSFTVTPENASSTDVMVDVARREGAKLLLLRPAYPAGEALKEPGLACDRDTFASAIDRARRRANDVGLAIDAPHPHEQGEPDFEGFGCVAAKVVMGISPTGDVTPCLNLPERFLSGNVRHASLDDLWRSGASFSTLRAVMPTEQCSTCRHYDTCRGGCRVRALHVGSGLDGPDSWCHYEPRDDVDDATRARLSTMKTKRDLLRVLA